MARKTKNSQQLTHEEAPRKMQKCSASRAPSDVERVMAAFADTERFPTSEAIGSGSRAMLLDLAPIVCVAESQHPHLKDVERMMGDLLRDVRDVATKALADADGEVQTQMDRCAVLNQRRETAEEVLRGARAEFELKDDVYCGKQRVVATAEAGKVVSAQSLAVLSDAQQRLEQEQLAMCDVVNSSVRPLLVSGSEDKTKNGHLKATQQVLEEVGAEAALVASVPSALSKSPADRSAWDVFTVDTVQKVLDEAAAKLDARVAAGTLAVLAAEAEDMGSDALVERFNSDMSEAFAARNVAEQTAADAAVACNEAHSELEQHSSNSSEALCSQTLCKEKMVEVDSLLFAMDQVCTRHERAVAAAAAEAAAAEAAAAAAEAIAAAAEAAEAEAAEVQAVEEVSAEEPAAVCADPVSEVDSVACMEVTATKVDPQFVIEKSVVANLGA